MSRYTSLEDWYVPGEGDTFRVVRPVLWEVARMGSGWWLAVPVGYVFDVSVPRWLRWAVDPRDPRYFKAAALHDRALDLEWDRLTAAAVFAGALQADGVGRLRRLVMVLAVIVYRFD